MHIVQNSLVMMSLYTDGSSQCQLPKCDRMSIVIQYLRYINIIIQFLKLVTIILLVYLIAKMTGYSMLGSVLCTGLCLIGAYYHFCLVHKTSFTQPLSIKVPVPSWEMIALCVLWVSILLLFLRHLD